MSAFAPLKRCARVQYGLGQPPVLSDNGVPIIRATNINRGRILASDLIRAEIDDLPLDRAPLLQLGEVLVVRSGAYTGDSARITEDWVGAAPGYDLRVTPSQALDSRFLAYTLLGQHAIDQIDIAKSRAAQPHLNAEDLGNLDVLRLPIAGQRAIADYLDCETARIDALLAAKRQLLAALHGRWTSLIHHRTVGSLRSTPQVQLRRIAALQAGAAFPHVEQGDSDGTIPYVKVGDLSNVDEHDELLGAANRVTATVAAMLRSPVLPAGTIVLPKIGAALLTNRRAVLAEPSCLDQNVMGVTVTVGSPRFVYYCLAATDLGLLSTPGPVPLLNEDAARALHVPWPADEVQQQVAAELDAYRLAMRAPVAHLTKQLELLAERRQALITAAVAGNLPIPIAV